MSMTIKHEVPVSEGNVRSKGQVGPSKGNKFGRDQGCPKFRFWVVGLFGLLAFRLPVFGYCQKTKKCIAFQAAYKQF